MWTDESLKKFGGRIQQLIAKQALSRRDSYEMFRDVLLQRQPELQQGAFLAALAAKGETAEEIAGAWEAIVEFDTAVVSDRFDSPLVENSGTGMDQLKTFNVSTAAAVVAAAGGARLARHGARALTSLCGTVDLLEYMGIDAECDASTVVRSIRDAGIGIFNGMSPKIHPVALFRILGSIRFGSTLNIAASLASPCRPTHALRGVYSKDLVPKVSEVMKEIGYQRALVVHGYDATGEKGMDELSILGESVVHEFSAGGAEDTYTVAPEDFGLRRAGYESVSATGNLPAEAVRFLSVISGRGFPECIDFTCLNAGAVLYLTGDAGDIRDGVEQSRELIHSGRALAKLTEWVMTQTDPEGRGVQRYLSVAASAGIAGDVGSPLSRLFCFYYRNLKR